MGFLKDIFGGIHFIINSFFKIFKSLYEYKIISYIMNAMAIILLLLTILYFGTKP
jgi:hypothetical protein